MKPIASALALFCMSDQYATRYCYKNTHEATKLFTLLSEKKVKILAAGHRSEYQTPAFEYQSFSEDVGI